MAVNLLVLVIDDLELEPDVLEAWEDAGVPGVTVLDSQGSRREDDESGRDDLPLIISLRSVLSSEETNNRMLFSVIDDEAVLEKAIQAAEHIIGDFRDRHTGIMFVVPVSRAWGILKVQPRHSRR
jgi:nitrogen regulatory protein P-II 1